MGQGSRGYQSNKRVRTSSNGNRARHGYNYWLELIRCLEVNRGMALKARIRALSGEMYPTVREAFDAARKR